MEIDEFKRRRQRLERLASQIAALLDESGAALDSEAALSNAAVGRQEGLRVKLDDTFRAYLEEHSAALGNLRTRLRDLEEAKRKATMAEKKSTPVKPSSKAAKDQAAKIEKVSEELSTSLRLDRVDRAIKDLLEFLADAEFFAANASRGRRQRLRALQNAIDKALSK